jgi:hypothetical protein
MDILILTMSTGKKVAMKGRRERERSKGASRLR